MNFIDEMTECNIPLDKKAIDFFLKLGSHFIVLVETTEKDIAKSIWYKEVYETKRFVTALNIHQNFVIFNHDMFYGENWASQKARILGYLPIEFPDGVRVHL